MMNHILSKTGLGWENPRLKIERKLNNKRFMASSINTYKSVGTTGTI